MVLIIERDHQPKWTPTGEIYGEGRGPVGPYLAKLEAANPGVKFRATPANPPQAPHPAPAKKEA